MNEQWSDKNIICPYCKKGIVPEPEDYTEDDWDMICPDCDKKFRVGGNIQFSWQTWQDCTRNGHKHEWTISGDNENTGKKHATIKSLVYAICAECGMTDFVDKSLISILKERP